MPMAAIPAATAGDELGQSCQSEQHSTWTMLIAVHWLQASSRAQQRLVVRGDCRLVLLDLTC